MKLFSILCVLVLLSSNIYAYEEIPDDAKSHKEDNSTQVIASQAPDAKSRLGKNTILNLSGSGSENINVVLVDKSVKRLYIASLSQDSMEVIKEFPILTGRVDGNKVKRGDEKTPEGVYYVISYSSGDELVKKYGEYALIYGAGSFPLNYPNIVDKIENKTGGGIWLHGVKPDLDKTYTQGCVAMNNTNFASLYDSVTISTPTIISEKLLYADVNNYDKNRQQLLDILKSFITAWQENDKDLFKKMVHSKFKTASGSNYKRYVNNKINLMDIYPDKVIRNSNTKVFMKDDNYTLFDTDQYYCAANLSTFTNKKYYFIQEDGGLKLISEEISSKSIKDVPELDNDIKSFVENWASSWRNKDIEKYMTNYDFRFKSGREDYSQWKKKKGILFAKGDNINLNISDIKWSYSGGEYKVEFIQEYSSGDVKDKGIKTLTLSGCPSFFKIKSETWRAI